jgi:hypothetical protein
VGAVGRASHHGAELGSGPAHRGSARELQRCSVGVRRENGDKGASPVGRFGWWSGWPAGLVVGRDGPNVLMGWERLRNYNFIFQNGFLGFGN